MFTGIIKAQGRITGCSASAGDMRLEIDLTDTEMAAPSVGDSIAVAGVCLTAAAVTGRRFSADVSRATFAATTLGGLAEAATVNLEPALRAGDPLGGHLVSGHVDGIGQLAESSADGRSWRLRFAAPSALCRYLAAKGSVAVDGISLTINAADDAGFEVNVVPHTMAVTALGQARVGDAVNLEVDQVARYLERLLDARAAPE